MANDPKLTCYAYVDVTHEFVAEIQGDPDPIVIGNVLYPRNTTTIKPPAYSPGSTIPVFNPQANSWSLKADYRGRTGYDPNGVPVIITQAGNPSDFMPPLTTQPPAPVDSTITDPNLALRTSKVAFFRRTTEIEAAQFMADLAEASPRLKAIFDSVSYLVPGTEEYPDLRAAVEARVGPERADELLAPSND
jgi:hypothetical protein